ncbi:MAG: hypothetical protein KDJ65_38885 [Anaerolineae bacterium]|nr:hypothetical protein [Anaerolineae bacterium]
MEDTKMIVLSVVVDRQLKDLIREVASQEKRTMSQWAKLVIEKALKERKQLNK